MFCLKGTSSGLSGVIINLLNNAVKYSPEAEIIIVRAKRDGDHLIICVEDFGIGIAKEEIGQLFKRFFRVNKTAMQYQGVGLGLYIASEIVKKHNGDFTIESKPGKGSNFCFRLPLS